MVDVNGRVPQGSILSLLLFLICISGLATGLSWNAKIFANESFFSASHNAGSLTK